MNLKMIYFYSYSSNNNNNYDNELCSTREILNSISTNKHIKEEMER